MKEPLHSQYSFCNTRPDIRLIIRSNTVACSNWAALFPEEGPLVLVVVTAGECTAVDVVVAVVVVQSLIPISHGKRSDPPM